MHIDTVIIDPLVTLRKVVSALNKLDDAGITGSTLSGQYVFQHTNDDEYTLQIANSAGDDRIQLFGDGLIYIGPDSPFLALALAANQTGIAIKAGSVPGTGTAVIYFESDLPAVAYMMYANGGDRSFRRLSNRNPDFSTSDPSLCFLREDWEQDGVISWGFEPADNDVPGPWDGLPGKGFGLKPGGSGIGGASGEFVELFSGLVGRGLRIGAVDPGGIPNVITRWAFQIRPNDGLGAADPNPCWLLVGNTLRQVIVDGANFLKVV